MEEKPFDHYQDGAAFAQEVQEGLKEGKTFQAMFAFPPERAAHVRDVWKEQGNRDLYQWFKGYVSRWD